MLAWLIPTVVSVIGCMWGWRYIFRQWHKDFGPLDWGGVIEGAIMATITCWMWPLFLLRVMFVSATTGREADAERLARFLAGRTPEQKREDADLARREREVWIAQKERELGIGV